MVDAYRDLIMGNFQQGKSLNSLLKLPCSEGFDQLSVCSGLCNPTWDLQASRGSADTLLLGQALFPHEVVCLSLAT